MDGSPPEMTPLAAAPPRGGPVGKLRALVRRAMGHRDLRHASMVTIATVAAQIVLVGTTPILSRLFAPADFGHLGLLLTTSTIGGSVAALCFHFVILLPKSERIAAAAFRLSLLASLPGSLVALLVYALALPAGTRVLPDQPVLDLLLVGLGILSVSNFTVFTTALSRANRYRAISISKFNLSFLVAAAQIALGLGGHAIGLAAAGLGLLVGRLVGQAGTNAAMSRALPPRYRPREVLNPRWAELRAVAKRYRDTVFNVPRELLMRAGTGLPPILILAYYGPVAAGLFFFAERLVERPGVLLGDSLTRLPMKIFAERVRERKPVTRAALTYTALSSGLVVLGILALAIGGEWVFVHLFGQRWAGAAAYATTMAVGTGVRIGILPIAALVPVFRIQRAVLALDTIFIFRVAIIPIAAHAGVPAIEAVAAIAAVTVVYNLVTLGLVLRHARRYDAALRATPGGAPA